MEREFLGLFAATRHGHGARPQHPQGAEFGDFHEEICADRHRETHARGHDSGMRPRRFICRRYSTPVAKVKASSCAAWPPASCRERLWTQMV